MLVIMVIMVMMNDDHNLDDDNDNDEAGVLREERPCSLPVEEAAHRHLSTCRGQTGAERKMIMMIQTGAEEDDYDNHHDHNRHDQDRG